MRNGPPGGPRLERPVVPRRLVAVALLVHRPMEVTSFGRSPWFRNRPPQNFVLPPSGDVHVGTRRPSSDIGSFIGSAVLYPRRPGPGRGSRLFACYKELY